MGTRGLGPMAHRYTDAIHGLLFGVRLVPAGQPVSCDKGHAVQGPYRLNVTRTKPTRYPPPFCTFW